jgi:O-antigen/teichoic acid export membrane protein
MANSVSRSRSALLGTLSSQAFTIISMLVSIVSTPLMLRYLDKEAYGLSILFFQITNYLSTLDLGIGTAVIRQLAMHRGEDEHNVLMVNRILSTGTFAAGVLGAVVVLVSYFFAPFVPNMYHLRPDLTEVAVPIICWMGLFAGLQFLQRGPGGLFFAHHRQTLIGTPTFVVSLTSTILTIALLAYGVGLWAFVYSGLYQLLAGALVQFVLLRRYYPHLSIRLRYFDAKLLRELFNYGIFLFINGAAGLIIMHTDRLVIGQIISLAAVSVFSITTRIPEVVIGLIAKVMDNATPALMEITTRESDEQARVQYKRILVLVTALSMLSFWLVMSLDEWFIDLWVGGGFFAGQWVLVLALALMVQQTLVRTGASFLYAKGITKSVSLMGLVEAPINITLSIFLGHRIGLPGVLIGTLVASLLTSVWYTPYLLSRHLGLTPGAMAGAVVRPMLGISLAGVAIYGLVWGARHVLPDSLWLFGAVGALCGILLTAFTWLLFLRTPFAAYVPVSLRRYLLVTV